MLLKTITLRNYRKYKNVTVELPDGVIGIIGLNGVGKTTMIEAIGWVLFGHHAARTKKELIKREGASPNDTCSVALEFELGGDGYKVVREMVGKNLVPKASLVINGALITNNAEKVTEVIEDNIGMDYQSFFTSVFARQKELNALSSMKAAERKMLILRMLGIERIEQSIQTIREDKRGKEKKIEGIKAATVDKEGRLKIGVLKLKNEELTTTKEAIVPVIKEIETAMAVRAKEAEEAKYELETATRKYDKYVALSNNLGERRSDLENTQKRRDDKERELAGLRNKKERLMAIEKQEEQYFELRGKKEELEAIRERHRRKKELMARVEKAQQDMTRREEEITGLKADIAVFDGVEAAVESLVQQKDALDAIRVQYQQKVELIKIKERAMREIKERGQRTAGLREESKVFDGVEAQLETVKRRIEEVRREKDSIHALLGALKSTALQTKKDVKESIAKKRQIEELGPEGECPMCERPLGTHYEGLIQKLNDEIAARRDNFQLSYDEYRRKQKELDSKESEADLLIKDSKELDKRVTKKRELDVTIENEDKELNRWRDELNAILIDLKPFDAVQFEEQAYKEVSSELKEVEKRVIRKRELEVKITHEMRECKRRSQELELIKTELAPIIDVEFDETAYKDVIATLKSLEVVYREIVGLRAEIGRMAAVKQDIQTLNEQEREVVKSITALQRQVEDLAFDKMAYVALKAGYERKRDELNDTKLKLMAQRNEFANVCREIGDVQEDIEEQKRLIAEKEKEETAIMYLNLLEKLMNDFKVYMVGRIRPMLSDYASDTLRMLTDGKYSKLVLDENYEVFIYDEGTQYELNRFSGGEEDLANLCLRLAISAVVSERSEIQTNFIILDEIFGSQDALRKRNIITALNALSKKFRQIFLITHIEEVKDYMEYVLRVTEDEEGVSWVRMER
ncbi:MAG: SMC family ATPase [Halobacteriota archaeon]